MLDISDNALNSRIDALRSAYAGRASSMIDRNRAFLRAYSPEFDVRLGELDQWPDAILQADSGRTRSSFNIARAVVELWTSLEAADPPAVRWQEPILPTPVPSLDPIQNEQRVEVYRTDKLVSRQIAALREQNVQSHLRRSHFHRHWYNAVTKKNIYGHSWIKSWPDMARQTFSCTASLDPSTVYPVWSMYDDAGLDAILVATRRSSQLVKSQYPNAEISFDRDGITAMSGSYYQPTDTQPTDADRRFIWVEDYWLVDHSYTQEVADDTAPVRSMVVNVVRVNGKIAARTEYPGWRRVPFFFLENPDGREQYGASDIATMLPIQDSWNRFLSQQQDVIAGESRPKFIFRSDSDNTVEVKDGQIISLDTDEDLRQLDVHLDTFPTQVHGQQLLEIMERVTGLPDVVWGRIDRAQNSGRALTTAWRAVSARMTPRALRNTRTVDELIGFWVDCMELYGWDSAPDLYNGNRDFVLDWPNKEPRDQNETTLDATNRLNAGGIDLLQYMKETGVENPEEMLERVRADYMDPVIHPEKSQAYLLLQHLKQQMAIEAQQAGLQQVAAAQQLAQQGAQPPGGAPSGANQREVGAANQAQTQAAQQGAPQLSEGQNAPGSAPGAPANAAQAYKTQILNGEASNRLTSQGPL